MKKHKYLFVACLSLFPVMAVAGNDTLHEIMEVPSATNINKILHWILRIISLP